VGGRVLLKCENLQRVGAFKFRGAFNAVSRIDRAAHPGGVVAVSSGNHAQGVAEAARLCGLTSTIVMPADAPPLKIARTRQFGGETILYDRAGQDREAIAAELCASRKAALIHPFDDRYVIAGQGTAGLELAEQAKAAGATLDAVATGASGGGLAGGVALAVKHHFPQAAIHTAEPAGFDDFARSLNAGEIRRNEILAGSICDALLAASPGRRNFAIARKLFAPGIVVTDDEARVAVRYAFEMLKLVVEPGGCVGLAALLAGKLPAKGRTVAVILSGGNIDPKLFGEILGG
jgi:threonine dehydratase